MYTAEHAGSTPPEPSSTYHDSANPQRISVHLFVGLRLFGPVAIHFNRYVARPGGRWIALADGLAGGLVLAIV